MLNRALDEALPDHSSVTHIANAQVRSATDPLRLSTSQSAASGPLHQGDRILTSAD